MKILFYKGNMHVKNMHALNNYKNIEIHHINSLNELDNRDLSIYDCVFSPCVPIDVSKYPNTKFLFGPQFSVFPEHTLNLIKSNNSVYNLLSDWVINIWSKYTLCDELRLVKLPFGVDTNRFTDNKPITNRDKVMLYFKHRDPNDLQIIKNLLNLKNISYEVFSYDKKYNENDYIQYLQNTKYGIWVDAHESQGFALQEALSCNVSLLVWCVKTMNQEYGSNYPSLECTTIPYWDERCGEYFYNPEEFEDIFNKFLNNLNNYKPRDFILENLSMDVCEKKLIDCIKSI